MVEDHSDNTATGMPAPSIVFNFHMFEGSPDTGSHGLMAVWCLDLHELSNPCHHNSLDGAIECDHVEAAVVPFMSHL